MNTSERATRLKIVEGKLDILLHAIEKMEGELDEADGPRMTALLKLIRMGKRRIEELRTLH